VNLAVPARRVLVREVNWLGDVVMSLPALRAVRRALPAAKLSVLIKRELAGFFDGVAWVDEVLPFRVAPGVRGLIDGWQIVGKIRSFGFDLAILLPRSFESALWVALARVPTRVGFADDLRGPLLTHRAAYGPALFGRHQRYDYVHMLRETLGIEGDADDYVPEVHEPHRMQMRRWLYARRRRPSGRLIALAVAAAYGPAKEWPAERYAGLIDRLADGFGAECVLVGAPGERPRCEQVAAVSRNGALVAAGETGVGEAMALLSLCDGFAGNDSGSMHVAGALGVPTVGIYGSTRPHRTGPLGAKAHALQRSIDCSPCMKRTCRFGHYDCLRQISVEDVVCALRELGAVE
jgi:heptosyltransferase II